MSNYNERCKLIFQNCKVNGYLLKNFFSRVCLLINYEIDNVRQSNNKKLTHFGQSAQYHLAFLIYHSTYDHTTFREFKTSILPLHHGPCKKLYQSPVQIHQLPQNDDDVLSPTHTRPLCKTNRNSQQIFITLLPSSTRKRVNCTRARVARFHSRIGLSDRIDRSNGMRDEKNGLSATAVNIEAR